VPHDSPQSNCIIRSWNIDNICHVKEEKSYVNSATVSSLKADDFEPTGITEAVFAKNAANEEAAGADLPNPAPAANASAEAAISPPSVPSSTSSSAVAVKGPTVLNPKKTQKQAALSYNDYVLTHEAMLEHYSEIQGIEDTKEYLFKHSDILLHEHSQSYLLLSCLEDEMNGKHKRMKLVIPPFPYTHDVFSSDYDALGVSPKPNSEPCHGASCQHETRPTRCGLALLRTNPRA
jgi:hypothetical protein